MANLPAIPTPDTFARSGKFEIRFTTDITELERLLRRLAPLAGASFRETVNRVIHQSFTSVWRDKWRDMFEDRWYRQVTLRTGLSGQSWVLSRGKQTGTTWNYSVNNTTDYARWVHPAGRRAPLFETKVPIWTKGYAKDVEQEIERRVTKALYAAVTRGLQQAAVQQTGRRATRAGVLASLRSSLGLSPTRRR